jgi:hypothetical protein
MGAAEAAQVGTRRDFQLHPGFPQRHVRVDHARHRRDPARTADRSLRVLHVTPLPGSEDHLKLARAGAPLCRDEWERAYTMAWQRYYTVEHAEMIIRRAAVTKANVSNAVFLLT